MITRDDAEQTVTRWALTQSRRAGHELTPMLHEFDLGFVVWTRQPARVRAEPGDGTRTVIDRETGELTHYSALPLDVVEGMYRDDRASRPATPATVDRAAELRRQNERRVTPTVAAHLTLAHDDRLRRAFGAKANAEVNHHRLIREWLDGQAAGHLVRGAERHAELIVVSDTLHELDAVAAAQGRGPLQLDDVRTLFAQRRFEAFHVRDTGDERGSTAAPGCASCVLAYVHLGLFPAEDRFLGPFRPYTPRLVGSPPDPDRFPTDVADIISASGWHSESDTARARRTELATEMTRFVLARPGVEYAHTAIPAALEAMRRYVWLECFTRGPGGSVRVVPFVLDPRVNAGTADALGDFGRVIGAPLFPLGEEAAGSVIAIDAAGRVFVLDQGGEWFMGENMEAALVNMSRGTGQPRVRADGTW